MKPKQRRLLAAAAALLLLCAIALGVYLCRVADYRQAVREIVLQGVDPSGTADGTYTGSCDVNFISATVQVTVEGGRMTGLTLLEHHNERGAPAERILDRVTAEQRTDVDTIAGATNSSRVILKAVENALASAPRT